MATGNRIIAVFLESGTFSNWRAKERRVFHDGSCTQGHVRRSLRRLPSHVRRISDGPRKIFSIGRGGCIPSARRWRIAHTLHHGSQRLSARRHYSSFLFPSFVWLASGSQPTGHCPLIPSRMTLFSLFFNHVRHFLRNFLDQDTSKQWFSISKEKHLYAISRCLYIFFQALSLDERRKGMDKNGKKIQQTTLKEKIGRLKWFEKRDISRERERRRKLNVPF